MRYYYTYVLLCADNTFYCGFTDDLDKRLLRHNSGNGDAKYTKSRLPVRLAGFVRFDNEHDARSCEWWFKHKVHSHSAKMKLISEKDGMLRAYETWKNKRGK
ncbi:MAG: GIY-YIG nuclease family protein [Streptococcaceae bacterium]|nr:GIY-YIG nuclease family protein [Streptococcaceae bacterium]